MAQWSIPVQPVQGGWKLRVLSGRMLGTEFDLPNPRYVLGSQPPSDITIPHPDIAPRHVAMELRPDGVTLTDQSGRGVLVNGRRVRTAVVAPGDHVEVGPLKFEFSNPNYKPPVKPGSVNSFWAWVEKRPLWQRVGAVTLVIAGTLFLLLAVSGTPTLVPVTLLSMSAVVPATVICWLVERYDASRLSFFTLTITFLAGGTLGVIVAMINFLVMEPVTLFILAPVVVTLSSQPERLASALLAPLAGFMEEPAKQVGPAWRWRHPGYDRPMDGMLLGTVSGFGFAVMETAGYGFSVLTDPEAGSVWHMLWVLAVRSISSPFAHGLWSGIVAAAFWACGRDFRRAAVSKEFWLSLAIAIALHGLWNSQELLGFLCCDPGGYLAMLASAVLSVYVYRQIWRNKGYFSLDPQFWTRR